MSDMKGKHFIEASKRRKSAIKLGKKMKANQRIITLGSGYARATGSRRYEEIEK